MSTEPEFQELYGAHLGEVQARWEASLERCGQDAAVVHSGTPLVSFLDDYEYPFRPNPLFLHWLPLTHHHDSVLLVRPGERPRLYFYQPDDYWYQPPSDPAGWWADHFDIEVTRDAQAWQGMLKGVVNNAAAALGDSPDLGGIFSAAQINPPALLTDLHLGRTRKTPYEIACMSASSHAAARAHRAAEEAFRQGCSELEIHQAYLEACQQTDDTLPYHNIVALNEHGAVLHYQGRETSAPADSRSFLIDAGCTVNAYCSDITRTYARDGGLFADILAAMDELQLQLVSKVRAGADFRDLHIETHRGVANILDQSGVINVDPEAAVASGLSAVFYPHGLGHFIGLQTHDVAGLIDNQGQAIPRPEGHPFLRLTRVLESDNVLTIEPGLYFIEPLLRRWRENGDVSAINWDVVESLVPYGGVRIEDNVVVTDDGSINLTRPAFDAL